jgi:ArsR family transcriptional regulator
MQRRLKTLADPNRFQILKMLVNKTLSSCCERIPEDETGCCVADVVEAICLSQPTVSHHLRTLEEAGLVIREKRGTWACYFANPRAVSGKDMGCLGAALFMLWVTTGKMQAYYGRGQNDGRHHIILPSIEY